MEDEDQELTQSETSAKEEQKKQNKPNTRGRSRKGYTKN